MKCDRLLNREIIAEVAALGHTEYLVIADCGLPVPKGVKSIDVSITAGTPSFLDVLNAVSEELVIESVILALSLLLRVQSLQKKSTKKTNRWQQKCMRATLKIVRGKSRMKHLRS